MKKPPGQGSAGDAGRGKRSRPGRVGRHGEASEHLTTAATMYRTMDMRFWLEQAEAAVSRL